jgi:hypothetical protein
MACPVTPAAVSEARKTTRPAASSGDPNASARRKNGGIGSPARSASTTGASAGMVSVMAVAATGISALTVTPALASSIAQVRAKPTMPAFAAE